jgi:general secretion pathway protein G
MINLCCGRNKKQFGFTLIELLVVISIIGLLSSVVMTNLDGVRKKGRDARRIEDLRQIRNALELYFQDHGYYPPSSCGYDCNGYRYSNSPSSWNALAADLAPYLAKLPVDPINSNCSPWNNNCFSYTYGNVGRYTRGHTYDLTTQLEDPNHSQRCGVKGWKFYFDNRYWCTAFGGQYSNQIYEASIY